MQNLAAAAAAAAAALALLAVEAELHATAAAITPGPYSTAGLESDVASRSGGYLEIGFQTLNVAEEFEEGCALGLSAGRGI